MSRVARGELAEARARQYLERQGLRFVEANYRCRMGEIDLILDDRGTLVFVEVRERTNSRYGGAAASVDARKQARLCAAARHYLQARAPQGCARFDVVAIESGGRLEWIPNAFEGPR